MRPRGASSSFVVLTGHPTASPETRERLRPLSFAVNETRAKGKRKDDKENTVAAVQGHLVHHRMAMYFGVEDIQVYDVA